MRGWVAWQRFWFDAPAERQWRLFGRLFCGLLFLFYLARFPDLEFVYGEKGIFPVHVLAEIVPPEMAKYRISLLGLSTSAPWLYGLYVTLLLSLGGVVLGYSSVALGWLCFVLHLSFAHRALFTLYGFDKVATAFLFYFALSTGGRRRNLLSSLSLRLMQFQVAIIYAYSGWEKLKGVSWWKGEALWWVISNPQVVTLDFTWLARFPTLIALPTFVTLFWEIYFPAAMLHSVARRFWLLGGVAMHFVIAVYMNIPFFAAAMILSYVVFLSSADLDWLGDRRASIWRRLRRGI